MRPEDLNVPKNILFKKRPFPFLCDSKRPQSECRLMYTGADTCCQQPYALAVTCDYPHHPPVIYNSAGTHMEEEQAASPVWAEGKRCAHTNHSRLTYCGLKLAMADLPGVFIVCTVNSRAVHWSHRVWNHNPKKRGLCGGTKGKSVAG